MSEEQEMVEEDQTPAKKGGSNLLTIITLVFSFVSVLISGYAVYYLSSVQDNMSKMAASSASATSQVIAEVSAPSKVGSFFDVPEFTVNLIDKPTPRYLKLKLKIEFEKESSIEYATSLLPRLKDSILTVLSSKSASSLSTGEGKFALKEELRFRIGDVMGTDNKIINIYFEELVIQ